MDFQYEKERIFALDATGKLVAEITFPIADGVADINHTFVDVSLRGQGVAGKLMEAAVLQLQGQNVKVRPTCSYAEKWFSQHPEHQDLLATSSV